MTTGFRCYVFDEKVSPNPLWNVNTATDHTHGAFGSSSINRKSTPVLIKSKTRQPVGHVVPVAELRMGSADIVIYHLARQTA